MTGKQRDFGGQHMGFVCLQKDEEMEKFFDEDTEEEDYPATKKKKKKAPSSVSSGRLCSSDILWNHTNVNPQSAEFLKIY